jgi:protein-arginine kinase activator protein McsA
MDENQSKDDDFSIDDDDEIIQPEGSLTNLNLEELENQLNDAINDEDYELASRIRDEINKRTS